MEAILPPIGSSVLGNCSLGTGYVPLSYKVEMRPWISLKCLETIRIVTDTK